MKTYQGVRIATQQHHLWFHRLEQWDLDCWPLVCVHVHTPDRSRRLFCLWRWGIQIRPLMLTRKGLRIGRRMVVKLGATQ